MSEIGKSLDTDVYIITARRYLDKHELGNKTGQTCVNCQTEGKSEKKTKQIKCVNCQRPKESTTNSTQADKGLKGTPVLIDEEELLNVLRCHLTY